MRYVILVTVFAALAFSAQGAPEAKALRVLYLTKSAGFEHSAIKRDGDKLGYSEKVIGEIAKQMGATYTATKDASQINAANLKNYDVVIFYTSGNLTEPGTDKQPAMGASGVADLKAWVEQGGGLIGFHAACDSFRTEGEGVSPYTQLMGAEFAGHGKQFKGSIKAVDKSHPAMQHFPDGWSANEEWYTFKKFNPDMHVIAVLDAGEERGKQEMYKGPSYPFIWCRAEGKGRVYYNGLGHREDTVWDNKDVQASIADAIRWAAGEGALDAESNYKQVVDAQEKTLAK